MTNDTRIPVTILTGFLGAGKTTVLNRLIGQPAFAGTAVIVNEFGDTDIDGALVQPGDERAYATSTGCLCCTVSGDVRLTLLRLREEAERGIGPSFSRVVIETTGLADPAPVIQTFLTNDIMLNAFVLNGVVTVLDAVNGVETLDTFEEARRQVGVADLILLSKADLASQDACRKVETRLKAMNSNARLIGTAEVGVGDLFSLAAFDPAGKAPEVADWLRFEADAHGGHAHHHHHHDANRHGDNVAAYCLTATRPLDPWKLESAIAAAQSSFGRDFLRLKAIVAIDGQPATPFVFHAVQHIVSPPRRLPEWPAGINGTRIVAILAGPGRDAFPEMFVRFLPELVAARGAGARSDGRHGPH